MAFIIGEEQKGEGKLLQESHVLTLLFFISFGVFFKKVYGDLGGLRIRGVFC